MPDSFTYDVSVGLLSSLLYTLLAAVIAFVVVFVIIRRERRRLLDFFAIDPQVRRAQILLSRLDVVAGGSQGADGVLRLGFIGPALMGHEYNGARAIQHLFDSAYLDNVPKFLRTLVSTRREYLGEVATEIDVAPAEAGAMGLFDDSGTCLITIGSDVYSHFVRMVYRSPASFIDFVHESDGVMFNGSHEREDPPSFRVKGLDGPISARSVGREIGTVQRVTLPSGRRVTMCAGISSATSRGAAEHLARNWRALEARFRQDDFLVVLSFPGQQPDEPPVAADELVEYARHRPPIGGCGKA